MGSNSEHRVSVIHGQLNCSPDKNSRLADATEGYHTREAGDRDRQAVEQVYRGPCPCSLRLRSTYELVSLQIKQTTAIDPAYGMFRVGPGGIELRHIYIASLERVSRGSWQPKFIIANRDLEPLAQ